MKKIFSWLQKFKLWILGGFSSLLLVVTLFSLRSRKKQLEKYEAEKKKALLSKRLVDTATGLGEVSGRDSVLAMQEKEIERAVDSLTEEIHEVEKTKDASASDVADFFNSVYRKGKR